MELIAACANSFIELFKVGAHIFTGFVTGIIPLVIVLMTAVNSLIKIIGEQRFYHFAKKATKYKAARYTIVPVLSVIFLTSPMCFTFGRFVDERYKPAFYDAQVSFVHPVTGLFPHANGGELFVYMGIAAGIQALGYQLGDLAVRYFLVGIVVIFLRGIITERIYFHMCRKAGRRV
ncbi:PTS glucitol/sorbitol transporter subunit IIC [Anaeroglobus geminatus]|jgi:PTS system, glucitol/sorbitol-specific, IIC component|uniref:PTS system, glucitol/sorbitol-specific, IIC component n=1 Tax=Anaeroglobus geminatus F0357 TaxID=861450 RepID=G9YHK6_9FIRM|nr:PTS glucitol/sorbitol transporter subunit IIC [Anaeroglobus geminatus]EHM40692.1 PTS system, glucitol/sorbitol-specific, IIC component [Anaeroglobus geminatus F0357]